MAPTVRKYRSLFEHPRFLREAFAHRVAAATEHLSAIRYIAANTLLDVGANKGQFSLAFHVVRPDARIIAFEPMPDAADTYERVFAGIGTVSLKRVAIAERDETAEFFVADRADSSSLLAPGKGQELAFGVRAAHTIKVPVERLDRCVDINDLPRPILLKIDVQGGELRVLEGCGFLEEVDFVYVELSFVQLYVGQPLFREVGQYLAQRGFEIAGVFNQVVTPTYGPTQADVLFRRGEADSSR